MRTSENITLLWHKENLREVEHIEEHIDNTDRAYLEINFKNLENNVNVLKKTISSKCELMAVLKAQAYGHGMYEIATYINKIGVKAFAVATIDEEIKLRSYGIEGEILILGYTSSTRAKELCVYDLTQTLIDYDYSMQLCKQNYNIKAHIKIDTGMHRLRFDVEDIKKISDAFNMNNIKVCGIYSHLCAADTLEEEDIEFYLVGKVMCLSMVMKHLLLERYVWIKWQLMLQIFLM